MKTLHRIALPILAIFLLSACGKTVPVHVSVPYDVSGSVMPVGFPANIRGWSDEAPENLGELVEQRLAAYRLAYADYFKTHGVYPDLNYLALSGGAYDGAFGAGLLAGWQEAGTRPDFSIVTGTSTGALAAPFIFLGPHYDDTVRDLFTTTSSDKVFMAGFWDVFDGLTGGMALTDNTPLVQRIKQSVTKKIMKEIAAEHAKGKRLFIGTTNIEAQRGVIWDIGAIASSGNPHALKLIHQVLLASASIPGAFKPVFIDVEAGGRRYQEIHADGGVTSQVFIYPLRLRRDVVDAFTRHHHQRHLYIVRNSKIAPEYKSLQPGFFALSRRSVETLIKYQGLGDLYRLYVGCQRDNIGYNLIHIPDSFNEEPKEVFDPVYMTKLYQVGFENGKASDIWAKSPPGVDYAP